jgi:hypothetical protein
VHDDCLWFGHQVGHLALWFEHRPGWIQLLIVLVIISAFVVLTHCDELHRAREWAEFKAWQKRRQRAGRLKGVR